MKMLRRGARAFWEFWLDFLVGDTPEIFFGVLVVIAVAILLRHQRVAGLLFMSVATALLFVISTLRGRQRAR